MPSLKEFVAALQAGWFPALAALVGYLIVISGDWFQLPYLATTPKWLITTAVIVGVFAFSVLIANVVYLPVIVWKKIKEGRARKAWKISIEREVFAAPHDERNILAYLVTSGKKAFAAELTNGRLVPLVAKGMIIRRGGQNNVLEWPYVVQEDVWQILLAHKDEFHFPNVDRTPDPFHWRNN